MSTLDGAMKDISSIPRESHLRTKFALGRALENAVPNFQWQTMVLWMSLVYAYTF